MTVMVNWTCQKDLGWIISLICLTYIQTLSAQVLEKRCDLSGLNQCSPTETCSQTDSSSLAGVCKCLSGYQRIPPSTTCVAINPTPAPDAPTTESPTPSSMPDHQRLIVGFLIPLFLVLTVVMAVAYAARRYHWVQKLRAMRQRRYDEVQFGQEEDDPPLA